jgi:hypothetical protein
LTHRAPPWAGAVALALAEAAACGGLGPDFDQVVAIEVAAPDSAEELDTLRPQARALDGRGATVSAAIAWATVDTAPILQVVDSTTGVTAALRPGTGRLQARVGSLRSNLLAIRVLPAADTVFAAGPTRDTVILSAPAPDSLSDSLGVLLQDTTAAGPMNLPGRPIVFALTTYPSGAGPASLVTSDTARALITTDTVVTSAGLAAVKVRLLPGTRPDSVVVQAAATRAVGTAVAGSPVTFVVEFQP